MPVRRLCESGVSASLFVATQTSCEIHKRHSSIPLSFLQAEDRGDQKALPAEPPRADEARVVLNPKP